MAAKKAANKKSAKKSAAKKSAKVTGQASATSKRATTKAKATKSAFAKRPNAAKPAMVEIQTTKETATAQSAPSMKGSKLTSTRAASTAASSATKKIKPSMTENTLPKPRFNKDGFGYTKDFPLSFIKEMYEALQAERVRLTGQASRLEEEAHALVEGGEMGDVQFDDEGGEGDTIAVERERDLTLSAQARETVIEIDDALKRMVKGTYGYSVVSGLPIPQERLEAIPWSSVLVEEKVGGIGRR